MTIIDQWNLINDKDHQGLVDIGELNDRDINYLCTYYVLHSELRIGQSRVLIESWEGIYFWNGGSGMILDLGLWRYEEQLGVAVVLKSPLHTYSHNWHLLFLITELF